MARSTENAETRGGEQREPLRSVDVEAALADPAWDDALHIAAPWERRSSLCGEWNRNLVDLEDERPDDPASCWTCLMAADWIDANRKGLPVLRSEFTHDGETWEAYAHRLEKVIARQRKELDELAKLRGVVGDRKARKRIADLERLLGVATLNLAREKESVRALVNRAAEHTRLSSLSDEDATEPVSRGGV